MNVSKYTGSMNVSQQQLAELRRSYRQAAKDLRLPIHTIVRMVFSAWRRERGKLDEKLETCCTEQASQQAIAEFAGNLAELAASEHVSYTRNQMTRREIRKYGAAHAEQISRERMPQPLLQAIAQDVAIQGADPYDLDDLTAKQVRRRWNRELDIIVQGLLGISPRSTFDGKHVWGDVNLISRSIEAYHYDVSQQGLAAFRPLLEQAAAGMQAAASG